ncbi:MAG: DUF4349 domain-containing protein [Clostridia bacterium]|nr:DUF4349 domain-containing protein [Clostridia bacterium]
MKRLICILAALSAFALMISGCAGSAPKNGAYPMEPAGYNSKLDGVLPAPIDEQAYTTSAPSSESGEQPVFDGRKLIRDAELSIQTLEFDALLSELNRRTAELGGYVESSSTSGRSYYDARSLRRADIVLRIPSERLDEFLGAVNEICNVTSSFEKVQDVTSQYIDLEARLASLRTEYDSLLGLLEKADSLDSIITLQNRLSDVRYSIESYEAQKRSFDGRVAYSSVTMQIREVERETAVGKESFSGEVSRRFSESLSDIGGGFTRFAAWLLGEFPRILLVLIIAAAIVLAIVFLIRRLSRSTAKRESSSAAEREINAAELEGNAAELDESRDRQTSDTEQG